MKYCALGRYAEQQLGLVTLDQLRTHYSDDQVTRFKGLGLIRHERPRVFAVLGSPPTFEREVLAVLLSNRHAVASHRTAAYLWQIIGLEERDSGVHISMSDPHYRKLPRVISHRSDRLERIREKNGFRLTNPERTLIDMACTTPVDHLRELIERAIQRRLLTLASLRRENESIAEHGRNGVGIVRDILDEYDPDELAIRSPFERRVHRALVRAGLPVPVREFRVETSSSTRFVDFAYPDVGMGIEADSRAWHTRLRDFDKDRRRQGELAEAGLDIFPVTWANFDEDIERICRVFCARNPARSA